MMHKTEITHREKHGVFNNRYICFRYAKLLILKRRNELWMSFKNYGISAVKIDLPRGLKHKYTTVNNHWQNSKIRSNQTIQLYIILTTCYLLPSEWKVQFIKWWIRVKEKSMWIGEYRNRIEEYGKYLV